FELSWHREWPHFRELAQLSYDEGRAEGQVAGVSYETVKLKHGGTPARGYRLRLDGKVIAYAGDTQATPELDELVKGSDVVITEATQPGPSEVHTSWQEAQALAARHPQVRFIFNHVFAGEPAGAAQDLQIFEL